MQWRHLLKPLCVSGEFSLLQNAPILRLQFQVNIFKNSPNKQMRFRINAEFLSATQGYCAQLSSREFCGRMCARETMAHACPWLKPPLSKIVMLFSADWMSPRPPGNLANQLIADLRDLHIQTFCRKYNLGRECWEKPNKSVGWHCHFILWNTLLQLRLSLLMHWPKQWEEAFKRRFSQDAL